MLHLSKNLLLIRQVSGLTQTEFGKLFGATKAMIVSYEKEDGVTPKELFITRVAKYAGVSEVDLINRKLTEGDLKIGKVEKEHLVFKEPEARYLSADGSNVTIREYIDFLIQTNEHYKKIIDSGLLQISKGTIEHESNSAATSSEAAVEETKSNPDLDKFDGDEYHGKKAGRKTRRRE